jgi:hypothetical protein
MSKTIEEALATAEAAGYRIDALLGPEAAQEADSVSEPATVEKAMKPEELSAR